MSPEMDSRTKHIEESGIFFENVGLPRMAGRIFGFLMVSDKQDVSFEELTRALKASKSSISNNVRILINIGFIKAISHSGERKTYYCLSPEVDWVEYLKKRIQNFEHFRKLLENGYELRPDKNDDTSEWLRYGIEFYLWISERLDDLLEEWRQKVEKTKQNSQGKR